MVDTKELNEIIKKLESIKKKQYSNTELRNRNQMMNRLDRMQNRDLNRRISLTQAKLRNDSLTKDSLTKDFLTKDSLTKVDLAPTYDLDKDDGDILDMFGIQKKKKVKKNRGGFLNFVR